jgi:hypothetical protein
MQRIVLRLLIVKIGIGIGGYAAEAWSQRFGLWPTGGSASLQLVRYDVQLDVHHPLAQVRVVQEFLNPGDRELEATFVYRVPLGATVNDLALWVNGVRREARVMERQKAREIYQGIVNQQRDPALVERLEGGLFQIRIFPVPAKRRTRVELRFVEVVEQLAPGRYRVMLRKPPGDPVHVLRLGLTLVAPFSIGRAELGGYQGKLRETERGYQLGTAAATTSFKQDIELQFQSKKRSVGPVGIAEWIEGKTYLVAEIPREVETKSATRVTLLIDRSGSMAAQASSVTHLTRSLMQALPQGTVVRLLPYDFLPRPELGFVAERPAQRPRLSQTAAALTYERGTAMVPAFEAALAWGADHIICFTDGASPGHQAEWEHVLRQLHDRKTTAVSLLHLGQSSTNELLAQISQATGGLYLQQSPKTFSAERLAALARRAPKSRLTLGESATARVLAEGPTRLVIAARLEDRPRGDLRAMRSARGSRSLVIPLSAQTETLTGATAALWAEAEIRALTARIRLFDLEEKLRPQIIALSQRHRVASEYTAFLVTETDADYDRPTSGQKWQRQVKQMGDDFAGFQSTPEPHEIALIALALVLVWLTRKYRRHTASAA